MDFLYYFVSYVVLLVTSSIITFKFGIIVGKQQAVQRVEKEIVSELKGMIDYLQEQKKIDS